ncbi:hypothetical protein HDF08_003698 [Edaphobacter lichenicola]|uniref:Uncharacterized protein n=1 Tax=Tunturiibacter lichenicola TaxID=2051959 RepID=A0A852VK52_9BACT|nr:hypothetical protein [Edaphobacter lichenicola]
MAIVTTQKHWKSHNLKFSAPYLAPQIPPVKNIRDRFFTELVRVAWANPYSSQAFCFGLSSVLHIETHPLPKLLLPS